MARPMLAVPRGHGELLEDPPYAEWSALADRNAAAAAGWGFSVAGVPAGELRERARAGSLQAAEAATASLGIAVPGGAEPCGLIAMTGHQPELYGPGVWVKTMMLQRFMDQTGAAGVDLVVDTDSFDSVHADMPCMRDDVRRCRAYLAIGDRDGCYACAPVPDAAALAAFRTAGMEALSTLTAPAIARHYSAFCDALDAAAPEASSLAGLVTRARRTFEAPVGSEYLELPVTEQISTSAWAGFVADIACDAGRFAGIYNSELAAYRLAHGMRSPAQPFPDLAVDGEVVELPFWSLARGRRETLAVRGGAVTELLTAGSSITGRDARELAQAITESGARIAPKALALTLFNRMFVSDLFVHGVGGGRYDGVTDGVISGFYGVEPPAFAVVSLTMYLPLGGRLVSDSELAAAEDLARRIEQNPDQVLDEVDFETDRQRSEAMGLAERKRALVADIGLPDADKKALGARIRDVNAELAALLSDEAARVSQDRDRLRSLKEASDVLTDRSYPLCLWSPQEIADKVR